MSYELKTIQTEGAFGIIEEDFGYERFQWRHFLILGYLHHLNQK